MSENTWEESHVSEFRKLDNNLKETESELPEYISKSPINNGDEIQSSSDKRSELVQWSMGLRVMSDVFIIHAEAMKVSQERAGGISGWNPLSGYHSF